MAGPMCCEFGVVRSASLEGWPSLGTQRSCRHPEHPLLGPDDPKSSLTCLPLVRDELPVGQGHKDLVIEVSAGRDQL